MHILDRFLTFTSLSSPFKYEHIFMLKYGQFLPALSIDKHGNYFIKIGDSKTVFCCHLDTVSDKVEFVNHVFDGDFITTDGKTILGADDRAGVTLMTHMIENKISGLYYFFVGEEVGCIGSSKAKNDSIFKDYDRIIAFDRKHTTDVITKMNGVRVCSDEFATELSNRLNVYLSETDDRFKLTPCDRGGSTDSGQFKYIIPECTNISVGYFNEHTKGEKQNIKYLDSLANAVINIDWESLPKVRKATEVSIDDDLYDYYDEYYNLFNHQGSRNINQNVDCDEDVSAYYVEKMKSSDFNEFELKELGFFMGDNVLKYITDEIGR